MSYILFYSNIDDNSKKFISILEQSGLSNQFARLTVDRHPQTGQRPNQQYITKYQIKKVPTIIVENMTAYHGTNAFKWITSKMQSMHGTESRNNKNNIKEMSNSVNVVQPYTKDSFSSDFVALEDISKTLITLDRTQQEHAREFKNDKEFMYKHISNKSPMYAPPAGTNVERFRETNFNMADMSILPVGAVDNDSNKMNPMSASQAEQEMMNRRKAEDDFIKNVMNQQRGSVPV